MYIVVDAPPGALDALHTSAAAIGDVLKVVAGNKGIAHLVVVVRILPCTRWRAVCHAEDGLIDMRFATGMPYPCTAMDIYGWKWTFPDFASHLAVVASHELYHYRAHHFPQDVPGYDPRDETAGNVYALAHAQQCGFQVQAQRP